MQQTESLLNIRAICAFTPAPSLIPRPSPSSPRTLETDRASHPAYLPDSTRLAVRQTGSPGGVAGLGCAPTATFISLSEDSGSPRQRPVPILDLPIRPAQAPGAAPTRGCYRPRRRARISTPRRMSSGGAAVKHMRTWCGYGPKLGPGATSTPASARSPSRVSRPPSP